MKAYFWKCYFCCIYMQFILPGFIYLISNPAIANPQFNSNELEYKNGNVFFKIVKDKKQLTFSDELGSRNLEIRTCNKKIIDDFWNNIVKNVNSLHLEKIPSPLPNKIKSNSQLASSSLSSLASTSYKSMIKYDNTNFKLFDFDSGISFLDRIPKRSHVIFSESYRLCKE